MPDSRSSLPSTHRFATTLPHTGASASNHLEPKDLFLGETFANLWFVRFGSYQRVFNVHFRQSLLGILGCFQFDVPLLRFLCRTELPAAAQDHCHGGAGERRLHSQAGKTSCRQGITSYVLDQLLSISNDMAINSTLIQGQMNDKLETLMWILALNVNLTLKLMKKI